MLDDPVVADVAERLGRTPAQVVLRWHIAARRHRVPEVGDAGAIEENIALFDFELEPATEAIDALDRGEAGRDGPTRTGSTTSRGRPSE